MSLLDQDLSDGTIETYAQEVRHWADHLWLLGQHTVLGQDVLERGDQLLLTYYLSCIKPEQSDHEEDKPVGDAASTMGKRRAALYRFYDWAVRNGRAPAMPFETVTVKTKRGLVTTLAGLRGGRGASEDREAIPEGQIDRFIAVGINGRLPDGQPDSSFRRMQTVARSLAGFSFGLATGCRHDEILHLTVFELPRPHPEGLTPMSLPASVAKGEKSRDIVTFSRDLVAVWDYIKTERALRTTQKIWRPARALELEHQQSGMTSAALNRQGRIKLVSWESLDEDERARLWIPGFGSPLLLLSSRPRNGGPVLGQDSLNSPLAEAENRCKSQWPEEAWHFRMHHARHTYATRMLRLLHDPAKAIADIESKIGRRPRWAGFTSREDPLITVARSMGHSSIDTTARYTKNELWDIVLRINADPEWNPALDPTL